MLKKTLKKRQSNINMGSIFRSFLLPLVSIFLLMLFLFGVGFGQQTGQLPGSLNNNNNHNNNNNKSETSSKNDDNQGPTIVNSNNYAASISLLTSSNKPMVVPYHESKKDKDKIHTASTKSSNIIGLLNSDHSSSGYRHHLKHAPSQIPESYLNNHNHHHHNYNNGQYSPYMMPVSNYYTGSSSTVSSSISPYQYTHYYSQAESTLKPQHAQPGQTLKNKLLKSSSSNVKTNTTNEDNLAQERLAKQIQLAVLYNQLMAMQHYRSMYGSGGIGAAYNYPYSYPNTISSLYNYYNSGGSQGSDTNLETSASSTSSSTSSNSESSTVANASNNKVSATDVATNAAQLQALASVLAYRQHLSNLYGGLYGGGLHGAGATSIYGGFGYPSGLYGSSGYGTGTYSNLYGSMIPTGASGMLSSLAGGLSSLTGSGLGVLNTLGMLFG